MRSSSGFPKLPAGILFYALAAFADLRLTESGAGGALDLEGNPLMRATMARFGFSAGLWIEKLLVGAACVLIAYYGEREMKRRAPWLDRIPSTKWARDWVRSGDRSWAAYGPLYGAALAQALAAGSWLWAGRR